MAKEPTTSRIPMPGLSRIPLPGSIRPPTNFSTARPAQILRPPATFLKTTRTQLFSGLRPPATPIGIKKSFSGDRISSLSGSTNMVTKKTAALKKFFTRPDCKTAENMQSVAGKYVATGNRNAFKPPAAAAYTPSAGLTRSATFVRDDSPQDMPQMQQLTPMPAGKHRPPMECESTPLLNVTNAKKYFMGENLDASPLDINTPKQRASILESTRISAIGFGNTMDIVSPGNATRNVIGNTVCYQEHDAEQPKDVTQNLEKCNKTHTVNVTSTLAGPECLGRTLSVITTDVDNLGNLTKTLYNTCVTLKQNEDVSRLADSDATQLVKATDVLGRTLCVITSNVDNLENLTKTLHDSAANLNQNDDACRLLDFSDIHSPATNATYSNPGSSENLLLLDDVSIPSGFEEDEQCLNGFKPSTGKMQQNNKFLEIANDDNLDTTLTALAPNKANMKLPLNSTLNTERLLDLTMEQYNTPARQMNLLNLTEEECMDETTPRNRNNRNTTQLLYMTQLSASVSTTPDRNGTKFGKALNCSYQLTPIPAHLQSPMLLKNAQSDLVLPTRTPDEDLADEIPMDVDSTLMSASGRTIEFFQQHAATSLQDVTNPEGKQKSRFSFGLDLTESTLDCSIELVDCSLSSTALSQPMNNSSSLGHHLNNISHSISSQQLQQQYLKKQNSFDLDESLGILTPDQMKEFLDSTATNNTGNHTNNNNLDLKLVAHHSNAANVNHISNKLSLHQLRMDQTPSPEELPLDPVEVKTGINNMVRSLSTSSQVTFAQNENQNQSSSICTESISLHTDTEPSKTDQSMNKSCTSKFSNSFITSVTSVTSLDTGYQGDGEMSRPASRGACDHSPSNGPLRKGVSRQPSFNQQQAGAGGQIAPVRRQDPMTDSDFFTESDADDVLHRGDRRAQVIDGQLYGPTLQPSASVFISEDPQMEDSCMESSGIFTDVENRGDEDLAQMRRQDTHDNAQDLSPDADGDDSTETVRSNKAKRADVDKNGVNLLTHAAAAANSNSAGGQGYLSSSQTSSTIQSSMSTDHLSAATTLSNRTSYCSVDGSVGVGNGMDFKSFSSFDEAFDGESSTTHMNAVVKLSKSSTTSTTSWCEQQAQKQLPAVQRITSPRKHASLSSLCTENGVHGAKTRVINSNTNNGQSKTAATVSASASGNGSKSSSLHDSLKSITQQANSSPFKSPSSSSVAKFSSRSKTTPKVAKQSLYPNSNQSVKNKNNSSPSVVSSSSLVRKHHHSPNKWEAVMNQIANNKSTIRTNYSDVKSKVATRINMSIGGSPGGGGGGVSDSSKSVSPTARRSPTSVSSGKQSPNKIILSKSPSINGKGFDISALASKRLLQGPTTKRGRSYSKDSQKSSQSDISLKSGGANAGSPKLLAKTPLRAAKKRDVRNLSISPTDLGPPPKTQQTANGTSTRPKPAVITLTQKRFTSNGSSPTNCTSPSNNNSTTIANGVGGAGAGSIGKGSPPAKKFSLTSRRLEVKATPSSVKVPLKDNNRITPPANKANSSKLESTTEQVLENGVINNNNLIEKSGSNTRTNSRTSSPILNTSNVKKIPASSTAPTCSSSDKKSQSSRLLNSTSSATTRKVALHKQHQQLSEESPTTAESDDLQQMKILNRHSYNGPLNYQTFEEQKLQLQQLQKQTEYQNKSTEALGVLLQYLVYDLDAFACPTLKSENSKSKEKLKKTLLLLDETKSACSELQDQICEKEAYYTQREDELQVLHRCELEKAHSSLSEFQHIAKQQITELKSQIHAKDAENKSTLDSYCLEMENKLAQKQQQLLAAEEKERSLQLRLTNAEQAEQQLQEKISQIESSYSNRLQRSVENEFQLSERVKTLTKELDNLKSIKEHRERELKDKLNLSNDEISILRTSRRSLIESGVGSPRNCSSVSSASHMEISRLQSEAESLRCVLELKQKEISKLTKHNEELLRDADERNALQAKISLLESKNEMLQSELEIKSDKEKEYLRQIDEVQKAFSHETVKRTRLSYDNEALQWQLKQRSEQLHIVETKLHELSANDTCHSSLTNRSSLNGSSIMGSTHVEEISPPASPVIKAVIEKNDSVSWVLEMDDETPEVAASKMVKRAGSFRSVERSPSTRRQLSLSATASCGSAANSSNSLVIAPVSTNPLSQSMSATSVIREHSKNETIELSNRLHPRMRSKSVSVKSCDGSTQQLPQQKSSKKLSRQLSGGSALKPEAVNSWKESVVAASSSPYAVRPRTSTLKIEDEQDEVLFRRSSASKLITCDTSALNKGERLEMRSLPSHPSVHDLKTAKKCQEIQESAGEAMVSGTNSEDESCSASSDDVVSTASSSAASDSTTSSNQLKNSHMSFEEALLIEKMNSQAGTPMEVSWSEDVEGMPASSNTLQL